jgi:hypothetical protein
MVHPTGNASEVVTQRVRHALIAAGQVHPDVDTRRSRTSARRRRSPGRAASCQTVDRV